MDFISTSKFSCSTDIKTNEFSTVEDILAEINHYTEDNIYVRQYVEVVQRFLQSKGPFQWTPGSRKSAKDSFGSGHSDVERRRQEDKTSRVSNKTSQTLSTWSSRSRATLSRQTTPSSFGVLKINTLTKINIIDRELEEIRLAVKKLKKTFNSAKFTLKAEEENLLTDIECIEENKLSLNSFIDQSNDDKKARVRKDKFSKFLERELENKDREWFKMRIHIRGLENEYKRINSQQQIKLELRGNLHAVDIDKLAIECQKQREILEEKTKRLKILKKAVGRKGHTLISAKSRLNNTIATLKNIRQDKSQKEAKLTLYEEKELQDASKLRTAELVHGNLRKLSVSYRSPDVQKYMEIEAALSEVKKEKEVWEKRWLNAKHTLALLDSQVKRITPSTRLSKSLVKVKSSILSRTKSTFFLSPGKAYDLALKFH